MPFPLAWPLALQAEPKAKGKDKSHRQMTRKIPHDKAKGGRQRARTEPKPKGKYNHNLPPETVK
jgi:hypothetical protein